MLGFRHAATNRLENLSSAQFRNQKTECVPAGRNVGPHVASRPDTALDDSGQLQFAQGTIHCGPRGVKFPDELAFAGEPHPGLIFARRDRVGKAVADNLIFRRRFLLLHELIIQVRVFPTKSVVTESNLRLDTTERR